jgi:hypothetical protein
MNKVYFILAISFFVFYTNQVLNAQLGFFEEYWEPKIIDSPLSHAPKKLPANIPESIVRIDVSDTLTKISPYIGGWNLNTFFGGKIYDKPDLMEHINNLKMPLFRYPGGTGSNYYFWDLLRPDRPSDVPYFIYNGVKDYRIKWGDEPGRDYLSLDNSYKLRDSLQNEAIHVVNYYYARYGHSEDPVAQAAHYAANWVRYDNGRTKFWEIGNEVYGSWNPGYVIDTTKNQDGQPYRITGELYAQHCLVFLDSMRYAAAEIGVDIKIGATLGFQESRAEWDIPVLKILGDLVDYYIIHRYYPVPALASYDEHLQSIDLFYNEKAHIDKLINKYCDTYVPLIKTEWNTRFQGDQHDVSCTNGLHTILGYKGIINEGIGLSLKWNLIWGYKDGDTHGLISNENDNPLVEGIPKFFPRAPYHYIYHFRKNLGDVSINNFTIVEDSIDVFSSSFQSGHIGFNIVNRTGKSKTIAVNLENYEYGDRFYWYTLEPENNNPFSRKVLVNGQTNQQYDGGGPLNYVDIPPFSASTRKGIRLEILPYSATYVLVEGEKKKSSSPKHQANFNVYGEKNETVFPLPNSLIRIDELLFLSGEEGVASMELEERGYTYEISANGYSSKTASFNMTGSVSFTDTLQYSTYVVQIILIDSTDLNPVENVRVTLDNEAVKTSASGLAEFNHIDFGNYELSIKSCLYKENLSIDIFSDTLIILQISPADYIVTFRVIDKFNKNPISLADVDCNQIVNQTSLDGTAVFKLKCGIYDFTVQKEKYGTVNQNLDLVDDTLIIISLVPYEADIRFRLYAGDIPVSNAHVTLNDETKQTNAIGFCTFTGLETGKSYSYSIKGSPYADIEGNVFLLTDTTMDINYHDISYEVVIQSIDKRKGFNLADSHVVLDGVFRISDSEGKAGFIVPTGDYQYIISSPRYQEATGSLMPVSDTTVVVHLDLKEANIIFRVRNNDEPVNGAAVSLDSRLKNTNTSGMAIFDKIPVDNYFDYIITKEGFDPAEGSFFTYHDSTLNIQVNLSTGISDIKSFTGVFPVPATEYLTVISDFNIKSVYVSDINDRLFIRKENQNGNKVVFNVSSLPPGVYFAKVIGFNQELALYRLLIGI